MNKPRDNGPLGPIFQVSLVAAMIGFGIYFDRASSLQPHPRMPDVQLDALSWHAVPQRPAQAQGRDSKAGCTQSAPEPADEDPS